jgi:hypothetical protein
LVNLIVFVWKSLIFSLCVSKNTERETGGRWLSPVKSGLQGENMKKIFGVSLMLLLLMIAANGLWAQELKFDGYINSGVGVVTQDGQDTVFKAYGVDAGQNGYRFRLNGSYQNEAKTVGAKFRLQSQSIIANTTNVNITVSDGTETSTGSTSFANFIGYLTLPYAYGWVNFFDNKLGVNAGIIEDGSWTTGDWWLSQDSVSDYAGLGALLKVTPIDGLVIGAGAYAIGRNSGSNNNILDTSGSLGTPIKLADARYAFHLAYTMPDTFRFDVSYRTQSEFVTAANKTSKLYADLRLLAVKNLTAVVAACFDYLEDYSNIGTTTLSETFAYKMDQLNFGLNAVQFLFSADNKEVSLLFNPWISYALDNIVPRLDLVYLTNGRSRLDSASELTWHRTTNGFTGYGTKDRSLFSIRPSVKINLDPKTFIEIGDMFNLDFDGDTTRKNNVFYVDIKLSF